MVDQEEEFSKEQHKKWSRRNVHAPLDMLHAFKSGDLYDCTIRVGCDLQNSECSYKDFKCHKVILSASSAVFETMFLGHFREAKLGPDDPISLDRIDPEVFETAMKYIYGAVTNFKSVAYGIKVYKFANEMQITSLMTIGLLHFFNGTVKAAQIFAIFDLYTISGNQLGLNSCKKILRTEASVALESDEWLKISSESVEEFLKIECVYANEVDLLKALIRWGIYQSQQDGENFETGEILRNKILPGLQLIRFDSLTKEEFASLCQEELGKVLSGDEKSSILMSFITGDWNLMTTRFAPSKLAPRHGPYTLCDVKFKRNKAKDEYRRYCTISRALHFKVSKPVVFAGLKISMSEKHHESFQFEFFGNGYNKSKKGSSSQRFSNRGVEFCIISPLCKLVPGERYCLQFTLHKDCLYSAAYTLDSSSKQTISDGAFLEIETTILCAAVKALVFKKSDSAVSGNQPG